MLRPARSGQAGGLRIIRSDAKTSLVTIEGKILNF